MPSTNSQEKLAGLGAALYEMQQFCNCVKWLTQPLDQTIVNALIESMLIHVRVLLDFFEKRGVRKDEFDDVLSLHFGFPAEPVDLRPDYRLRINKEVAHLSYARAKRLTQKGKLWERAAFLPLVIRCIAFIDSRSEQEIRELERFRAQHGMGPLSPVHLKPLLSDVRTMFENDLAQQLAAGA